MWGVLISLSDSITYIGACLRHITVPAQSTNTFVSGLEPLLPVYQRVVLYGMSTYSTRSIRVGGIDLVDRKQVPGRPANYQDYWPLATFCWRSQLGGSLGYYVAYTWFVSEIL